MMLAQADLAMKMGDTKKALNMLKKIMPENRSFLQAKKKQAQIYLDELKDRNNYTRCYLEILDADASVANYKMVAQALMDIQEPEIAAAVLIITVAVSVSAEKNRVGMPALIA